jgi:membrane protease YdiL (CAAX protease family)
MAMRSWRLLPLAVLGEGALAIAGGIWLYAGGYPVRLGVTPIAVAAGAGVALALAVAQWWLQRWAPAIGPVRALRELQRTVFQPLFAGLSVAEMIAISALAGIGEEIFFRGAVQAAFGWPVATLAFGVCHVGMTRRSWVLGAWAAGYRQGRPAGADRRPCRLRPRGVDLAAARSGWRSRLTAATASDTTTTAGCRRLLCS